VIAVTASRRTVLDNGTHRTPTSDIAMRTTRSLVLAILTLGLGSAAVARTPDSVVFMAHDAGASTRKWNFDDDLYGWHMSYRAAQRTAFDIGRLEVDDNGFDASDDTAAYGDFNPLLMLNLSLPTHGAPLLFFTILDRFSIKSRER
jgi:hypothetical protein